MIEKMKKGFLQWIALILVCVMAVGSAGAEQTAPSIWEMLGVGTATEAPTAAATEAAE